MILKLILLLLVLFGGWLWLGGVWRRRFSFEPGYEEIHIVKTQDEWRIALYRYPGASKKYETPVLLCHGLGANRYNFDLGPEASLARFLQEEGFDVWSIDLRGRGSSGRRVWGEGRSPGPHVFDDYVRKDARAAIRHVLGRTGASQVHWIGHSMGGLVLYAVLEEEGSKSIASGVAIASPGSVAHMRRFPLGHLPSRVLRAGSWFHLSVLVAGLAPLIARIKLPGEALFLNRENVETVVLERALCHLVEDVSPGVILQFLDWMESGDFRTCDKTHSYAQNFDSIRQPLLFIAGAKDYLVPPESVAAVYDRISSKRKSFLIVGKEQGQGGEYGHGDLLIGKNVRNEIFPRILEWLVSFESAGR